MVPAIQKEGLPAEIFHDVVVEVPRAAILAIPYLPDLLESSYAVHQNNDQDLSRAQHHKQVLLDAVIDGTADFLLPLSRRGQALASRIEAARKYNQNIPIDLPGKVFSLSVVADAATFVLSIMAGGGFGGFAVRRVLTGFAEHVVFGAVERRLRNHYGIAYIQEQSAPLPPPRQSF